MSLTVVDQRPNANQLLRIFQEICAENERFSEYFWLSVSREIWIASETFEKIHREDCRRSNTEFIMPAQSKPPSVNTVLCLPVAVRGNEIGFANFELINDGNRTEIHHFDARKQNALAPLTYWEAGGKIGDLAHDFNPKEWHDYSMMTAKIAFIFSLMNEPNFTELVNPVSRQIRRRFESKGRKFEVKELAWNMNSDAIHSSKSKAKSDRHMPLHYRRGHWRRAEAHYHGAAEIDGQYYQWINEQWVGHPKYGIMKSIYAPKWKSTNG